MPELKDKIKRIIATRLAKARDCEFKKAWIPEGWSVVKDDVFVKELAEELTETGVVSEDNRAAVKALHATVSHMAWDGTISKKGAAALTKYISAIK